MRIFSKDKKWIISDETIPQYAKFTFEYLDMNVIEPEIGHSNYVVGYNETIGFVQFFILELDSKNAHFMGNFPIKLKDLFIE